MKLQLTLCFLVINFVASCDFNSKNSAASPKTNYSSKNEYAFIAEVQQNEDSTYLIVDYVQYLTGDSAIAAAIREGNADTTSIDGKITIGVPNDYYIVNDSRKLRRLPIDKNCEFDFLLELDRIDIKKVANSLSSLKYIYKDALFILTLSEKETIVRIKEIFGP